jgi:hypothetical protein
MEFSIKDCTFTAYSSLTKIPQTPCISEVLARGKCQPPQKLDIGELVSHFDSITDIHGLTGEVK